MKFKEETVSADVEGADKPLGTPCGNHTDGKPYFTVDDDCFFKLHLRKRGDRKWFTKHYVNTDVASWSRANKGKDFYLKHDGLGMFRKVTAK